MINNGIFCRMQAGYPILLGVRLQRALDLCVRRAVSYTFIIMSSLPLYIIRWRKFCFSLIEGAFGLNSSLIEGAFGLNSSLIKGTSWRKTSLIKGFFVYIIFEEFCNYE